MDTATLLVRAERFEGTTVIIVVAGRPERREEIASLSVPIPAHLWHLEYSLSIFSCVLYKSQIKVKEFIVGTRKYWTVHNIFLSSSSTALATCALGNSRAILSILT